MRKQISFFLIITAGLFILSTCDLFNPGLGNNVDINPPLLFVTSHANGDYVHGTITLNGNFEEDVATQSVEVSFDNGANYTAATLDPVARTWTLNVDTTTIPDGENNVRFRITDTSNKVSDKQILLYIDNNAPLVVMTIPSVYNGSAVYYGSLFQIKGETFDTFGVNSVEVQIWNATNTIQLATFPATGTANWLVSFNSQTYIPTTGTLNFVIRATDKAGNTSTKYYHYSDIYSANGYSPIAIDEIYEYFIGSTGHDSGAVYDFLLNNGTTPIDLNFDQDQNKPTIEIYNPSQYQTVAENVLTNTSRLSGKAIDADGVAANSVEIRIYDFAETPITGWLSTGNPLSPSVNWSYVLDGTLTDDPYKLKVRASDIGANMRESNFVEFTIDSGAPNITVAQPTQGQYLNGNFTVSGTATDVNNLSGVEVSIDDGANYYPATMNPPAGTSPVDFSYTVTNPPEGSMLLKVRATDGTAKSSTYNLQVIVDKTNPTVTFLTPALSSTVNGQVIFKGSASDNSQITKVELKVGKNDPFFDLTGTYNWEYTIDSASYANATHSTETPPGSDVWKLDVQARATDVANNVTTVTTYYIYVDNDTDKPLVNIISPTNGQNLAGPVLVTGSAFDDDAVDHVEMQIDINGDGDFLDAIDIGDGSSKTKDGDTNDRFENESTWYTISGTTIWTETINQFGEFYARTDTTPNLSGDINIRVRAVDINAVPVVGNYQQIAIHMDDLIPRFENLTYESGDYVNGTFTINGDAYDDPTTSISSIWISYNGGVNYTNIIGNSSLVTQVTATHYQLHIGINSAAYIPTSGIFYLRLKVVDSASLQSIQYINLNVDNVFPTGTWDSVSAPPNDFNSTTADVRGTATDSGTVNGISKVEVYLIRGGNVYNPRTGAFIAAGSNNFGDGDGVVPYTTDANYKIVIDNKYEEGNDGGANGDGDGTNESLTLGTGLTYDWWAEFNSTLLSDGAIDIHYLVFDHGGNGNHYTLAGLIANDKPNITGVTVGYDVDDSGAVQAGERFTYLSQFEATNRLYFAIAATDANTPLTYEVLHEGVGPNLIASGNSCDIDISSEPEGLTSYVCRVTDSTGVFNSVTVVVNIENDDTNNPSVTIIDPVQTDLVAGHLEEDGDSLHNGTDADVSGTITIRGTAFDNRAIESITLTLDGVGTDVDVATWNSSTGQLESADANFTITTQAFNQTGHSIFWSYSWNSATITNQAQNNVSFTNEIYDFTPNTNSDTLTIDVVPYISSLLRSLGAESTTRSKYGKYSVNTSETGFEIHGYNLGKNGTYGTNSWVRVYNTAGSAYDQVADADVSANGAYTTITLADLADITYSGVLRIQVNNIEAINNINDNTLTNNKEDDGSGLSTTLWNDDRYLMVFDIGDYFAGSDAPEWPSMSVNYTTGHIYGAWSSYNTQHSFYAMPNSRGGGATQINDNTYDPSEYTDILMYNNATDVRHTVVLENEDAANAWQGLRSKIDDADPRTVEYLGGDAGTDTNTGTIDHSDGKDEMLFQFKNPRIAVNQAGAGTADDVKYISYYDAYSKCLKYAVVTGGTATFTAYSSHQTDNQVVVDGYDYLSTASPSYKYASSEDVGLWNSIGLDPDDGVPVIVYYSTTNKKLKIARGQNTQPIGNFNTSAPYAPSGTHQWNINSVSSNNSYIGSYVNMVIDSNAASSTYGDLFIISFQNATGDLVYIHGHDVDGTGAGLYYTFDSPVTIDSSGNVGTWCDIALMYNGTTAVPYVSYLNSAAVGTLAGLKTAWVRSGTGSSASDWEYVTIPVSDPVRDHRTNIEASFTVNIGRWSGTANGPADVAVGFAGTYFNLAYKMKEQ